MRFHFVLSAPLDACDPYLRAIVTALRGLGHGVNVTSFGRTHPEAARFPERPPATGHLVVEAACLPRLAAPEDALADRGATLFVREPAAHEYMAAALPHLRRVIVTTGAARTRLGAEFGIEAGRIRVIEPGADPDLPRSAAPARADACPILTLDAAWPRSDHALLLRALARLVDLDWTLTVAGHPGDPELMAIATEHGIAERLRFIDTAAAPMLDQAWRDAGLCALATEDDGDGLTVAEALRRGVPLAAAGGPPLTASVPPRAGAIAAPGDLAALSNAMRRIIFDAPLRRDMAEAAWQAGRTLPTWDAQAHRFADMLGE